MYDNETYLQALEASRADVDRQMANTLAEIERQKGFNTERAAQTPGATQSAFNVASQGFNDDLAAINRAAGTELSLPEIRRAMDTHQAGFAEAAGLLGRGFGEQAGMRTNGANNLGEQLRSQLFQQRNTYIAQREEEDRNRAWQVAEAERQRQFAAEQQRLQLEAQAREAAANRAAMQAAQQQQTALPPLPAFVPGHTSGQPSGYGTWAGFAKYNPDLANFLLWTSQGDLGAAMAEARKYEWMTPQIVTKGAM